MSLLCTSYSVARNPGRPPELQVHFIVNTGSRDTEEIAEALKRIEIFLSGSVDLVKADDKKLRCFYCGSLSGMNANQCSQCEAAL